ncbi:hypothetical protein [Rubricoccus marinus]|uniref:Uncharacterized protein n=1 Tax=Rubricoccus marinus TaxID=716817 RepID=A0A259TW60_9BACT|nr:hypothetical protein [Rubricoccus marinus]OZC01936.1 hypothetical protein BSZ36_02405 [Rubricoccus marinus]
MLHTFRRSSRLATLLVLALVAGPAASALCPHAEPLAPEAETHEAAMDHGAMDMAPAPEAAPCHDEPPAPEPEPDADCLSACCAADAPAPVVPTLTVDAPPSVPLAAVSEAPLATDEAPAPTPEPAPPPEARLRVHLLLGRFLT